MRSVDFLGGFSANVEADMSAGDDALIPALPTARSATQKVCGSINVGSTRDGINVDAVVLVGCD